MNTPMEVSFDAKTGKVVLSMELAEALKVLHYSKQSAFAAAKGSEFNKNMAKYEYFKARYNFFAEAENNLRIKSPMKGLK